MSENRFDAHFASPENGSGLKIPSPLPFSGQDTSQQSALSFLAAFTVAGQNPKAVESMPEKRDASENASDDIFD